MRLVIGAPQPVRVLGVWWRAAILLNRWAVPFGLEYDLLMDCWCVSVLCFHVRFWRR